MIERMWINQPSTLQPLHHLHGTLVLADEQNRVYFLSGDVISQQAPHGALSKGWPQHLRAGAVKDWDAIRSHPCYDEHQPGCDCAALATRGVAPAEAVEDAIKAACIAWHRAKGSDPFNVLYNGAWCGSFPHQTGPERWTFTVPAMKEAIAAYLRAQPPARSTASDIAKFADANMTPEAKIKSDIGQPPAREVAPAEAGERSATSLADELEDMARCMDKSDGAIPCLLASAKMLRAQPPAREDAQPFMFAYEDVDKPGDWRAFRHQIRRTDGSICPGRALYTHPAPDALRVAVEALEKIKAVRVCKESANIWTGAEACRKIATEALATLKGT